MVLTFAGRRPGPYFPEDNVGAVRVQVDRLVKQLEPRVAVGSAAAGADLLVAEAVLNAGGTVEVLLTGDRNHFRAKSVADKGAGWPRAFDALLDRDAVRIREIPRSDDAEADYRAVTAAIAARARELAREGEEITLLAISRLPDGTSSHTEDLVEIADASRWPVLRIDPTLPAAT